MERNGRFTSFAICIAASALAACASTPDPKPEIQSARALVEQAEQSGAAEFAGKDLEIARDRLRTRMRRTRTTTPSATRVRRRSTRGLR